MYSVQPAFHIIDYQRNLNQYNFNNFDVCYRIVSTKTTTVFIYKKQCLCSLQGQCIAAAFWFAVLLNLKHIFAYIAPAYVIYLLRNYCFLKTGMYRSKAWWYHAFSRLAKLGIVVVAVFLASFGPFIFFGQLNQVISIIG